MADAKQPGPLGLGSVAKIDTGTMVLTDTPPPGVIGLEAGKSAPPPPDPAAVAARILAWAVQALDQKTGDGECFALVDGTLRAAGARSAANFKPVRPFDDYIWGTETTLADARPGDVIQFRNHKITKTVEDSKDKSTTFEERAPNHSAIIEKVEGGGVFTIIEQNAPVEGSWGHRSRIHLTDAQEKSGDTTTTYKVAGRIWIYHPQPK